jgi:autoinducer 2 (AI-2) kinase
MENAAYNTLGNLELICEAAGSFPQEVIFAGGASYSPTWCSILASVLGVPVKVPKVKESTALGAFICAAVGAGSFKSFDEATCSTTRTEAVYLPDENDHGVYREHYERWKQVYGTILSLSDSGVLRHMWKSPGE